MQGREQAFCPTDSKYAANKVSGVSPQGRVLRFLCKTVKLLDKNETVW